MTTLDATRDEFQLTPSPKTAGAFLRVAAEYWADEMIEEETFGAIVNFVATWLEEGKL